VTTYLLFFALVLGINLLPAFGPPTWTIIALYALNSDLPLPALILIGAAGAAVGRFLLAHGFRLIGDRLSARRKESLAAARAALERRKRGAFVALALFTLSPVPSAQLFEAAGLMKTRLLGFTLAFFAGRILSYTIYATSARSIRGTSLGEAFMRSLTSPLGIAVQMAAIALLVGLARIDWAARLGADSKESR